VPKRKNSDRFVLCRPLGGLNDVLCQIEHARRAARRTGRRLVVQTETGARGVRHRFGQKFSDIFEFVDETNSSEVEVLRSALSGKNAIWPPVYESLGSWIDKSLEEFSNGTQTQSRLSANAPGGSKVLVHEAYGGGFKSFRLLEHLTLNNELLKQIVERAEQIPPGSTAVHFRNSDYRSNYEALRGSIESLAPDVPVLLASDDETALIKLKQDFPNRNFVSSSSSDAKQNTLTQTESAVIELVLISGAKSLVLIPLDSKDRREANYSGFGLLAQHLWLVRQIQGRGSLEYSRRLFSLALESRRRRRNLLRLGIFLIIRGPVLFRNAFYPQGLYKQLAEFGSSSN